MKNIFTILIALFFTCTYSQNSSCGDGYGEQGGSQIFDYNNYYHAASTRNAGVILAKVKLEKVAFQSANITLSNGESKVYLARFNPYFNEMEIRLENDKTVNLKRIKDLKIKFLQSGDSYRCLSFINADGNVTLNYFTTQNGTKLFKKTDYKFIAAKKAVTGYDSNKKAKYKTSDSYYYKNLKDDLIKLSSRRKNIANAFPELSEDILLYIKENKVNLKKNKNLVALTNYIYKLESDKYINYDLALLNEKK
jgi:hypothetical protein